MNNLSSFRPIYCSLYCDAKFSIISDRHLSENGSEIKLSALSSKATDSFTVRQNYSADGTIDPSHIIFKFNGAVIHGIELDSDGDGFCGFSGVA